MTLLLPGFLILGIMATIGTGLFLTLAEVRRNRRDIKRHVDLLAGAAGAASPDKGTSRLHAKTVGWRLLLGTRLRALFAVGRPHKWGMNADAVTLILVAAVAAAAIWFALHFLLHMSNWIAPPAAAVAFLWAPRMWLNHQQSSADKAFMQVFPDSIDMVIRMLRAGLPITAAVRAVGNEGAPPVNAVFAGLADEMAIGISFEDALAAAGERIGLADFRFFAVAISLQRATGGNLAITLEILSDLMRQRRAMRMKARATTGEVRMSAYVLGGIPFFIIGGLLIMTPTYLLPLIIDPRGNMIIAVAVVSMATGFAVIRQMMRSLTKAS